MLFIVAEGNLMEKLKRHMQTAGGSPDYIANTEVLCAVCKQIRFSDDLDSVKEKLLKLAQDVYITHYHVESADEFYDRMKKKYPTSR